MQQNLKIMMNSASKPELLDLSDIFKGYAYNSWSDVLFFYPNEHIISFFPHGHFPFQF